jgi:hypothetical protein
MICGDDCGAIGGMQIGRANRNARRKSVPLCPSQNPYDLNWRIVNKKTETGPDKARLIVKIICF